MCTVFVVLIASVAIFEPTANTQVVKSTDEYQFLTKERLVFFATKKHFRFAHLDPSGNFVPFGEPVPRGTPVVSGPETDGVANLPIPKDTKPIETEAVYEYRSGRLISGELNEDGNFIPRLDSRVISLADYLKQYDPKKTPRIYNLPGRIVKREKEGK